MIGTTWFYVKYGQSMGPVAFAHLQQLVGQGDLAVNDMVWQEGTPSWRAVGTVPGLVVPATRYYPPSEPPDALDQLAAAQHDDYSPGHRQPKGYYGPSPVQYQSRRRRVGQSHNGMAIAGFVLSLVFPLLGLIFSWVALSGMKSSRNDEGKGLATAGMIISIAFLSLGCLYVVGILSCLGAGLHG